MLTEWLGSSEIKPKALTANYKPLPERIFDIHVSAKAKAFSVICNTCTHKNLFFSLSFPERTQKNRQKRTSHKEVYS
jgi:hypothetical protein